MQYLNVVVELNATNVSWIIVANKGNMKSICTQKKFGFSKDENTADL